MADFGADPALVASQSSQSSLSRPFGFDPGEPSHDPMYRLNLLANGITRALSTLEHRTTGRDPKLNGFAFSAVPDWALRQWLEHVSLAAQGIEAQRAETTKIGSVADESPVPQGCAQTQSSTPDNKDKPNA